jgi:hypothetical protein
MRWFILFVMQTKIKIAFGLLFFFFLTKNSFGQLASVGLSFGPTYSAPIIKNTSGIPTLNQYHTYSDAVITVFGQYNINKKFGVLFDFGISERGSSFNQPVMIASYSAYDSSVTYSNQTNKYKNEFTYLDNYVLAKYSTGNKIKVYGTAGMYFSTLLRARKFIIDEYYDSYGGTAPTEAHGLYTDNLRVSYKKSDLGFAVGVGVEYGRFGLDYRYSIGALNISRSPEVTKVHSSFSTVKLMITLVRIKKDHFKD